eukprot:454683_1
MSNSTKKNTLENVNPLDAFRLTLEEVTNLKVNDRIDHRDHLGRFIHAKIIGKKCNTNLKIHYMGWSNKWDNWCDAKECDNMRRFATSLSLSRRQAHRFVDLKKGDYLDINPIPHKGWKIGEIISLGNKSGQVEVMYAVGNIQYFYWAHLDDTHEIAAAFTKSSFDIRCGKGIAIDHSFSEQSSTNNNKRKISGDDVIDTRPKKRRKLCNSSNSNSTNNNNVVKESSEIKSDDECVNDILKENERLMKQNEELTKKNENIKKKKKKFKKRNQKLMEAIRANRELEMSNKENEMRHHNKMNLYNLQMEEFDVLSLEQLNELELKLHSGLNMIKEARDRLLENKLYCIICLKNAKNMFIQECGHMDICNQCEQNLPSKVCPRCQKAFVNITKVNI